MCCNKECQGKHNDCIHPNEHLNPKDCTLEQIRLCHEEGSVKDHLCEK